MSTIKKFKEKFIAETDFAVKFKDAKTAEDVVELAKSEGFEITVEDIKELRDSELENVAGGNEISEMIRILLP
jgi:predicted ribosomally synthesized peptide with nif11-like leader